MVFRIDSRRSAQRKDRNRQLQQPIDEEYQGQSPGSVRIQLPVGAEQNELHSPPLATYPRSTSPIQHAGIRNNNSLINIVYVYPFPYTALRIH